MATKTKLGTKGGQPLYRVRWRERQPDGSWRQRQQRATGTQAAEQLRKQMALQHEGPAAVPLSQATLADAAAAWLEEYGTRPRRRTKKRVEQSSWDEAARVISRLVEWAGEVTAVRTIDGDELEAFVDQLPVGAGSKDRAVGVLKAMWSDLLRRGLVEANVASDLPSYQAAFEGRRAVVPSWRALEKVAVELDDTMMTVPHSRNAARTVTRPRYASMKDGYRPSDVLWLLALTGARFSEARGLRVADDHGDVLRIEQTWARRDPAPRSYGKNATALRAIPVVERLRPSLDRLKAFSEDGMLMTGPDGHVVAYETWRNQLDGACERAGVKVTTHELRHVAASVWIRAGATPYLIMRAGGWSSLDMVSSVYGHLWPDDVVELGRKVDQLDFDQLP